MRIRVQRVGGFVTLRAVVVLTAASLLLLAGSLKLADYFAGRPSLGILAELPQVLSPVIACVEIVFAGCLFLTGGGG